MIIFPILLSVSLVAASETAPPDVLLISIDNLRADRVHPNLTPHLSSLKNESADFTNAYTQATWTLPAHASLLTSLYPYTHEAGGTPENPHAMRAGLRTLARVLRERGYSAASYTNTTFFRNEFRLVNDFVPRVNMRFYEDPAPDAIEWLLMSVAPRFLFLHIYAVHNFTLAVGPPKKANGEWRCPIVNEYATPKPSSCAKTKADYDRATYCADSNLGDAFAAIKSAGRWDNTLIIVTSDHGESLCDGVKGRRSGHGGPGYEELAHVPLMIKFPGGRFAGGKISATVELVDIAPTILDAIGLAPESAFQGRTLIPLAAGEPFPEKYAYIDSEGGGALRLGRWKVISDSGRTALFDLESDPNETKDLSLSESSRYHELKRLLRAAYTRPNAAKQTPIDPNTRSELRAAGYLP